MPSSEAEILNFADGVSTQSRARVSAGLDANPDDAARVVDLSSTTKVPTSVINSDLDAFDRRYKGALAQGIVQGNPALKDYVNDNPMAASVSNDDWATWIAYPRRPPGLARSARPWGK